MQLWSFFQSRKKLKTLSSLCITEYMLCRYTYRHIHIDNSQNVLKSDTWTTYLSQILTFFTLVNCSPLVKRNLSIFIRFNFQSRCNKLCPFHEMRPEGIAGLLQFCFFNDPGVLEGRQEGEYSHIS